MKNSQGGNNNNSNNDNNNDLFLAGELKKTMEHESDSDTNCNRCTWYSHQRIGKGTGGFRNKSTSEDHLNFSIINIAPNPEKSPGDLRRLAV